MGLKPEPWASYRAHSANFSGVFMGTFFGLIQTGNCRFGGLVLEFLGKFQYGSCTERRVPAAIFRQGFCADAIVSAVRSF